MAKNRKEAFLAAIAGEDVGELKPKNRQEAALDKIAKGAGGGGGGVVYLDLEEVQTGVYACGYTFDEVQAMIEEGKAVYVKLNSDIYTLAQADYYSMKFTSISASQGNVECAFANFSRDTGNFECGYNTLMGGIS